MEARGDSTQRAATRALPVVMLLGAVTGLAVALLAVGFVTAVFRLNDLLLISPRSRMMAVDGTWVAVATVVVPTAGGLVVGLLHHLIVEHRAHGPPEVIAAVQTRRGRLPARPGVLSALSALVALGSGASVGQYGPLVHLGGTFGSLAARVTGGGRSVDSIAIACGVAAAIATAFKAPIAGILFAHEVVLRHYALRAFAPVAAAAVVGFVVEGVAFGRPALFYVESAEVAHAWEYGVFLLVGAGGAVVATLYMVAIRWVSRLGARLPVPRILRPALAGAALGLAALWLPEILGIGAVTLRFATIEGAFAAPELAAILVAKILATAVCLGLGFSGGVFSPALVVGTLFGALCGIAVDGVTGSDHATMVVYAVCGMVAVTAPVIGAPLAMLLIVFELTGSYTLTIAALASVAVANPLAARLFGASMFDTQLRERGLDLSAGRDRAVLQGAPVLRHVSENCVRVPPQAIPATVRDQLGRSGHTEAFLVDEAGCYQGTVTLARLEAVRGDDGSDSVAVLVDRAYPVLAEDASLWAAVHALQTQAGEALPVVTRGDRQFLGVVYETAITRAYLGTLEAIRDEEHAAR